MRKILLLTTLLASTVFASFAQTSRSKDEGKFSIGLEGGLLVGDASNFYNAAIGASVKYEYPIATSTYFTISAGYTALLTKSALKDEGFKSSYGTVPLKAGIKYYIQNGFFAEGQLGAAFYTESGGGTAFAYSPGIGYTFDGGFEAGVRYEAWSKNGTTSQVALRLAYRF